MTSKENVNINSTNLQNPDSTLVRKAQLDVGEVSLSRPSYHVKHEGLAVMSRASLSQVKQISVEVKSV